MEIKDKPASMGVREWIVKKVALSSTIPEKVIKSVISHNYDSANEALDEFNSIEISGFGKFYYNKTKAKKEIAHCIKQKTAWEERCNSEGATEKKRRQAEEKVAYYREKIKWLENKNGTV